MKLEKLIDTACKDPDGRASTARFRLAGRTLWFKDNDKLFHPIISHCNNFVVDWGNPYNGNGMSRHMPSRTFNDCERIHNNVMWRWVKELGGVEFDENGHKLSAHESDTHCCPFPAVRVMMKFNQKRKIAVEKPTALATKCLVRGKHPENGTTRLDWCLHTSRSNTDWARSMHKHVKAEDCGIPDVYKNGFIEPFERVITSLAYGAVQREQVLGSMTMALGQLKQAFDTSAHNMVEEIQKQAEGYFAPTSLEEAGHAYTPLEDLLAYMADFNMKSHQLEVASNVFQNLAAAPDSICASVTTPADEAWNVRYKDTIGDIEDVGQKSDWVDVGDSIRRRGIAVHNTWSYHHSNSTFAVNSELSDEHKEILLKWESPESDWLVGHNMKAEFNYVPFKFVDHNIRSFSFYWARRNKEHYENVLGQIGCNLPKLFGQYPDEWKYEQMAASLYMRDQA
tara:strand:+ start:1946 stop:3301 length:1356 start_codon:yes stop_codon:yes gene_type:complete